MTSDLDPMEKMTSSWRIEPVTGIPVVVVGIALICSQFAPHTEFQGIRGLFLWNDTWTYGWPVKALWRIDRNEYWPPGARARDGKAPVPIGWVKTTSYRLDYLGVAIDSFVSSLVLVATAYAATYWRQRPRRLYQTSLRECFAIMTIVALLITIYLREPWRFGRSIYLLDFHVAVYSPLRDLPWYVSGIILFGTGCAVFAIARVALHVGGSAARILGWPNLLTEQRAAGDLTEAGS